MPTRRCGHCRAVGHDRRTCPDPTQVARRAAHQQEMDRFAASIIMVRYNVVNHTPGPLYLYKYLHQRGAGPQKLTYITSVDRVCSFSAHAPYTLVGVPHSVYEQAWCDEPMIHNNDVTIGNIIYRNVWKIALNTVNGRDITFGAEDKATTLDQWKTCGLKAMFLLNELKRLGACDNSTLNVIMDLVQDIPVPKFNELDKELSGIPSAFTNIT
jgi:hypothetical protein